MKKYTITSIILIHQLFFCICLIEAEETNRIDQIGRTNPFRFSVTCDQRYFSGSGTYDTVDYYRGVCETISSLGSGVFMISPGDVDPPTDVQWTIESYIGAPPDHFWFPGVGNHETETPEDMDWFRTYNSGGTSLPYIVKPGPPGCVETTYSFDYEDVHFVHINIYFDGLSDIGTDGDVVDELYEWLNDDLNDTTKTRIFVVGHEPAFPQPDEESGRLRYPFACLNQYPANRDRFWDLLRYHHVIAYISGHTHNYSLVNVDGVWQLDAGHARGIGDTGAKSTFALIDVNADSVDYSVYRGIGTGGVYSPASSGYLNCDSCRTYVFQDGVFPNRFYATTEDTYLETEVNNGGSVTLSLSGSTIEQSTLIKWDTSVIPVGSTVLRAWISCNSLNGTAGNYDIFEMKRDWQEYEANWIQYSDTGIWQLPGAQGVDDCGQFSLGDFAYTLTGPFIISLNPQGIQLIQSWIDSPTNNYGLIIKNYSETDAMIIRSREEPELTWRPKLTVYVQLAKPYRPSEASSFHYPMIAAKGIDTEVLIDYEPARCSDDHVVYWTITQGLITSPLQWTDQTCFLGSTGSTHFYPGTMTTDDVLYFVIVGNDGTYEGSYGLDSTGNERSEAIGLPLCDYVQDLGDNCP